MVYWSLDSRLGDCHECANEWTERFAATRVDFVTVRPVARVDAAAEVMLWRRGSFVSRQVSPVSGGARERA